MRDAIVNQTSKSLGLKVHKIWPSPSPHPNHHPCRFGKAYIGAYASLPRLPAGEKSRGNSRTGDKSPVSPRGSSLRTLGLWVENGKKSEDVYINTSACQPLSSAAGIRYLKRKKKYNELIFFFFFNKLNYLLICI